MLADLMATYTWRLVGMLGLLTGSAFFSGTETALFSLSRGQLMRLRHGKATGRAVARLLARPQRTLNLLLLGNMIVNVAYASIAAVISLELQQQGRPAWQAAAVSIGGLLIMILLGEVAPKMLAYQSAERWSLLSAPPIALIGRILQPIVWTLETLLVTPICRIIAPRTVKADLITADELRALLDLSARRGLLADDAHSLLQEIVQLAELRVADIMTPRVDMVACDINEPRQHFSRLMTQRRLRFVPVYEGDIDHILGLIHAKRLLLSAESHLRDMVIAVPFVPVTANIERVLLQFRQTRRRVAVAVDEYGGTAGLVTLDDILEEIVGDLPRPDELASGPAVLPTGDSGYLIDGDLAIHEWADAFCIDLHGGRISTIGGFVTSLLGRIPTVGDVATYRNLRFTVQSLRGRRVGRLRLDLVEAHA